MFGSKQSGAKPQSRIDSLIGNTTRIEGDINFSGGLRIDGNVCGNITAAEGSDETLVISEHASVEGEIRVPHVVVNGTVTGPIHAGKSLELLPNARVSGDVQYERLEMQQGAVVEGRLVYLGANKVAGLKLAASNE